MPISPLEYTSMLKLQIRLQTRLSNRQVVYTGKHQLGLLLDPASVTSQRTQCSQMRYLAQCAGVSRTIT
jgi:hypothetical protein